MLTIKVGSCLSSGLDRFYDARVDTIFVDDSCCNMSANFGRIYKVEHIDGKKPSIPVVAKIFTEGNEGNMQTVVMLQVKVFEELQRLSAKGMLFFEVYPALIALPLFSFEGTIDACPVKGYLSFNLKQIGFISSEEVFHHISRKNEEWITFMNRKLPVRYVMAYSLAESCAFLRRIEFLHADITADNLFVSQYDPTCALIDFDSGAFKDNGKYFPSTFGKGVGDWTAPDIINSQNKLEKMTEAADDWSVSVAIHHILTGFPAYLADDMSENTLGALEKVYMGEKYKEWPKFEPEALYQKLKDFRKLYLESYGTLDNRIKLVLAKNFTKGLFSPKERSSAIQWAELLKQCVDVFHYWNKWMKITNKDFPDIQSEKSHQIPLSWTANMQHDTLVFSEPKPKDNKIDSYTLWQQFIKLWVKDVFHGGSLTIHQSYVTEMANNLGLDGKKTYIDLSLWIDNLKRCKDKKDDDIDVLKLPLDARLIKIGENTYKDLRAFSKTL